MKNRTTGRIKHQFTLTAITVGLAVFLPAAGQAVDSDIVINEIMYHPDTDCELEEFIELFNKSGSTTVSLGNWRFTDGIFTTFPLGTELGPGRYMIVCRDIAAFTNYYGSPISQIHQWERGKLSNNGEPIELCNAADVVIDRVRYNDKRPWPISPDGGGTSLELLTPYDINTSGGAWRGAVSNPFSTQWTYHEVTGVPMSTTIYFYLDGAGECLIDDVTLISTTGSATNRTDNGGFEVAVPLQWTATGTHSGSQRYTASAHWGSACLRVVATGAGGAASGQVWQTCQPLPLDGSQYALGFWVRNLQPGTVLRVGMPGGGGAGWAPSTSEDIGGPPVAGGHTYNAGTDTYTVWGAGWDIWGIIDEFRYVYTTLNGDGSLEATVSRVSNTGIGASGWAKAGIMFRESNAANSAHAFCLLSWTNGIRLQYRGSTGGISSNPSGLPDSSPVGLRLTRQGNDFIAEADTGAGYSEFGRTTIPMNPSVLIGFAVTSHDQSLPRDGVATYDFAQPAANVDTGFFTQVSVPDFLATPGALNSRYSANWPPYIRNVDTTPDQPTSSDPIEVRAKITDDDGIASAVLYVQIVPAGTYIREGDPAYQTDWTPIAMTPASTPTYYRATIGPYPHRTLVRYRIAAADGIGQIERVPYIDDSVENYARFVYNGVPSYTAARHPGVTTPKTFTVLEKVPVIHLIANPADVNEAQQVAISDRVERRQFKWKGTLVFNGRVYDHIRFRMRGGTWRYRYQKRMWKFRFRRGHRLDFLRNDGTLYEEELRTLNLLACIQPPGNVPSWVEARRGDGSQRGEEGFVDRTGFWLWQQVGTIAPECTWLHFRIIDNVSEAGADQYSGDFFGLYLGLQGMDERMLRMSGRPTGNFYKIDSFGQLPGQPPWFEDARDCSLPQDDIVEFRREYGPKAGYPTPDAQWWQNNFELDSYYSSRAVIDCIHHGDLYQTISSWDGVESGKNYYYYHNPLTLKWEFVGWDIDLSLGTDHGGGGSPFRDRVVRNAAFPQFQIDYRNRLREVLQLLFGPHKLFPQLDQWYAMLQEIAEADMYRWDWAPLTASSDGWRNQWGLFEPLDVRLGDIKNWVSSRTLFLTMPPGTSWWLERSSGWPSTTCYDVDIPATPTLTAPPAGTTFAPASTIVMNSSAFSDPNPGASHATSKWIATHVGGNELDPDWTSGETATFLNGVAIPAGTLPSGDYWLRVRHYDNTGRASWWSDAVTISVRNQASAVPRWQDY